MKFPSHGLVYDYALEDGGVSRKDEDDDDDHKAGEVRTLTVCCNMMLAKNLLLKAKSVTFL